MLVTDYLLDDLALPDDTLQLFHDERADPHWLTARDVGTTRIKNNFDQRCVKEEGLGGVPPGWVRVVTIRTLFADERVVPVVGIVRVAKSSMRIFEFEELVAVLARMTRTLGFSLNVG